MHLTRILDPELLSAVDALNSSKYEGEVWRVTWAARDPLAGTAAGGRWSPDGRFEALYTSLKSDGALAEAYYHLSRAPVMYSSHMRIIRMHVSLDSVLSLNLNQLRALGIDEPLASRIDGLRNQDIGEAAYMMDYQGLIVPSARWDCSNLILFMDRIDLNMQIKLIEFSEVNWPAWKERDGF